MLRMTPRAILGRIRLQSRTPRSPATTVLHFSSSSTTTSSAKSSSSVLKPIVYSVIGGFVITTLGGVKWVHDHVEGTEGLSRTLSFYSLAIPKYIVYRYHVWRASPDDVWEELDRETSKQGLEKILELEGFYVKAGQMCASNVGNAFPEVWQDTMSVLQDECPAQPFEVIKQIVSSELDWNVFRSFDPEPIGAASIGQVHRAVLQDGTPVVVKVCYPNVERLLRGDVRTIKMFAQVAQPVHVPGLEEVWMGSKRPEHLLTVLCRLRSSFRPSLTIGKRVDIWKWCGTICKRRA